MKNLWTKFLSPTPLHIKRWQMLFLFIGGFSTVLEIAESTIPSGVKLAVAACGYLGTFLAQFAEKKEIQ
jgi:hypothetical protein